jgi:PKD repeat protein
MASFDAVAEKHSTVGFDSTSWDDDGLASQLWSFGDGETGSGAKPRHRYTAAGIYSVTLTVIDASGQSDSVTRVVEVD